METFKAFLDYFTPLQWKIIGGAGVVLIWIAGKLTDRYLDRWARERKMDRSTDNQPRP